MFATDVLYQMQIILMLCVLASVFYIQYRRNRSTETLMWFWGWVVAICRLLIQQLPKIIHGDAAILQFDQIAGNLCLMIAALLFMGSFSDSTFGRRLRVSYLVAMAVPILIYTVLQSYWMTPSLMRAAVLLLLVVATALVGIRWALRPGFLPTSVTLSVVGFSTLIAAYEIYHGNYQANFYLLQSAMNLCTGLFLASKYRKFSAAVVLTSGAFLLWAARPWVEVLSGPWAPLANTLHTSIEPVKVLAALGMLLLLLEAEIQSNISARDREHRGRRELQVYSTLDVALMPGRDVQTLATHLCQQIAAAGPFHQVAIYLRSVEQNFYIAGHAGMQAELAAALDALGLRMTSERLLLYQRDADPQQIAGNSFRTDMQSLFIPGEELGRLGFTSAITIPMRSQAKVMTGVLLLAEPKGPAEELQPDDLLPIESLAARFALAMEHGSLMQRLVQSEKLAGLGQLAGGVAHELNNPLTVVMGYAEMIEDSAPDAQTRSNAGVIRSEAQRMKQIIESLIRFWRPSPHAYHEVDIANMLRDIHRLRAPQLASRGVRFELTITEPVPAVSGNSDSLKQVFLQLLSNAADAVDRGEEGAPHRIRMDLSTYAGKLHLLVSDTGPGFADPSRVFDPFFTTKQPGKGTGLGLSICYGIVREHRGEINAFNMHPQGAAVVVELPPQRDVVTDGPEQMYPWESFASLPK